MKLGIDYKFRDDLFDAKKEGTTVPIELLVDPYQGVVYNYTTVKFKMEEDGVPKIQYDYDIIDPGKFSMVKLRKDEFFWKNLGLILNELLLEASEAEGASENRTDHNKELDQERDVHQKGSSVS